LCHYVKVFLLDFFTAWAIFAAGGHLMPPKKAAGPDQDPWKSTSLRIKASVYRRAWNYKLDKDKDLGEIISEAVDEYLKKLGA
jgi:hypothetical protein